MSRETSVDFGQVPDAQMTALLFAIDPHGFGGITIRGRAGPVREHFLARLQALMPADLPWRRLPAGTGGERLDGGLDLAATLALGRPAMDRGLLADSDGGTLVLSMAERMPEPIAVRIAGALETGATGRGEAARFGAIALDEGIEEEALSPRLQDRLTFWTDLSGYDPGMPWPALGHGQGEMLQRMHLVTIDDPIYRALTETAVALGVHSMRPLVMAARVARAAAALMGQDVVTTEHASLAVRLVFGPRATQIPVAPEEQADAAEPEPDQRSDDAGSSPMPGEQIESPAESPADREAAQSDLNDLVLSAAKAALPAGLLLKLQAAAGGRSSRHMPGRAGALQTTPKRGRPAGVRRDAPRGEARLNIIETLRAAAPWQRIRKAADANPTHPVRRVVIRRDDLRFTRFKQRTESVTLFAVDASGSLALSRLAEAKGAVELLLAECYVRRDQVALLAFRGRGAELLLPPTRSLARAKRCLADMAGGGATPLANAIETAVEIADQIQRRGRTPLVVFMTDGRANVARDGRVGRAAAESDLRTAAVMAGATGIRMLVVDAGQRPQPSARTLAGLMNAAYLPLPRAEATTLMAAVRSASAD